MVLQNVFVYSVATTLPQPESHIRKPSMLRVKSKPRAAWNSNLINSSPAFLPLLHVAVASLWYNFSTYGHLNRALSFSVEPFRNMRPGSAWILKNCRAGRRSKIEMFVSDGAFAIAGIKQRQHLA